MSRLVSRPCATCLCDRTHQGLNCLWCGTATILKPIEFIHDGRRTQRGYKPVKALTVNERKQRWRAKKARAAKLAQPLSMSSSAQRMRERRERRANGAAE